MKLAITLFSLLISTYAFADNACQAPLLQGQWTCTCSWDCGGPQPMGFRVSENNGIYSLTSDDPNANVLPLDGQPHKYDDVYDHVMTGTCHGPVIDIESADDDSSTEEQVTIQSAKQMTFVMIFGSDKQSMSCTKN